MMPLERCDFDKPCKISRGNEAHVPLPAIVTARDRSVLRELGRELSSIASDPVNETRRGLWAGLNRLDRVKPMVWINEICWNEMEVDEELHVQTSSEFCRRIELELRRTIYRWKHLQADTVVEPRIFSPLAIENSGIGVSVQEETRATDERNTVVSHRYLPQIRCEEHIEKIQLPRITWDEARSEETYQAYCDIFDGVIPVESRGVPGFWFAPWDDIVTWTGVQEALTDMVMRPDYIHRLVKKVTDAYLRILDQYEQSSLLALNNTNARIGSGGYGYTGELPRSGFASEHVRCTDIWGCGAAQIFGHVSPAMYEEFALQYERRWLERFGLTYYGCCEPLHKKVDLLRSIPNLRKISISPWVDLPAAAEAISGEYVFSWKPNPAVLAREHWDPEEARRDLEEALEVTQAYGCRVEIILKDISTVNREPQRLWEWAAIAAEVTERYGGI